MLFFFLFFERSLWLFVEIETEEAKSGGLFLAPPSLAERYSLLWPRRLFYGSKETLKLLV